MKNIWAFIKWQVSRWGKFEIYMSGVLVTMLAPNLFPRNSTMSHLFVILGLAIVIAALIHGLYYVIRNSYEEFCKERQELFNTIKHSDK